MKFKEKTKGVIIGAVVAAVAIVVPVVAAVGTKTINVTFKNISVVADGQKIIPKDSHGAVLEPFIYNGNTYLPIKAVGEAIGKNVSWDSSSNTVYIGQTPYKQDFMDVCKPYEYGRKDKEYLENDGESFTMSGKTYNKGFALHTVIGNHALFNTDGKYAAFSINVGHIDGSGSDDTKLKVYLDGNPSAEYELKADGGTYQLNIPINYAKNVKFELEYSTWETCKYGFANGQFY